MARSAGSDQVTAVLLEDTTGAGHRTRVVGDEPWLAIVVVLA